MIGVDEGRSQEVVEASSLLQNWTAAAVKSQAEGVVVGGENRGEAAVTVEEWENQVEGEALENRLVEGPEPQLESQVAEVEANRQKK